MRKRMQKTTMTPGFWEAKLLRLSRWCVIRVARWVVRGRVVGAIEGRTERRVVERRVGFRELEMVCTGTTMGGRTMISMMLENPRRGNAV